ncbi:MAG: GIY-YIG nuclease family protein [Candidatus Staskawiczbacteria bacterium]|nr:GIY-YIG nuclease family protein [Candidatus Staskawiczbacteria bacterium]
MKGIIYIMTTAVSGLIKIGQTGNSNYQERMRNLEANGYYNVAGLKRFFAIELEDYAEKEALLHDIFNKHRVGESELFALDQELIRQLLLSFKGKIIYPENIDQEKEFDEISEVRKQSRLFNFYKKGLKNGDIIVFKDNEEITAKIVGEREVEYEGQVWKLSPLAYKLYEQRGELNDSGAYAGADYFKYSGKILRALPDIIN